MIGVSRLARIGLTSRDPDALARFYEEIGFVRVRESVLEGEAFGRLVGIPGASAHVTTLRLGREVLDLVGFRPQGRPYPAGVAGWNPLFQHFAIVVSDISAAFARLSVVAGWAPISAGGPVHLPARSGGVFAYKFRDPEGHPLELLAFAGSNVPEVWRRPAGQGVFLGIDHSAISVADTARSEAFYHRLGLRTGARSLNVGPEQARLDAVPEPVVEVTALEPPRSATPHVELLCYRGDFDRPIAASRSNDIASTRLVFAVDDDRGFAELCDQLQDSTAAPESVRVTGACAALRDPDGHEVWLTRAGAEGGSADLGKRA